MAAERKKKRQKRCTSGSDDADNIFFRFQGTEESPVVLIGKVALAAAPDSLLAVLAEKRWQQEHDDGVPSGGSPSNPINIKMNKAPCKDAWKPELAKWIVEVYECYLEKKGPNGDGNLNIGGIPNEVELEQALDVLDYFGLTPEDPGAIDMSESSKIIQIRARLFLRQIPEMHSVKEFIVDDLIREPAREKRYIFAGPSDDVDLDANGPGPFPIVKVCYKGIDDRSKRYFEWVEGCRMRDRLISALQDEGLEADFMKGSMLKHELDSFPGSISHNFQSCCPDWHVTHDRYLNSTDTCKVYCDVQFFGLATEYFCDLYVLRVKVPDIDNA